MNNKISKKIKNQIYKAVADCIFCPQYHVGIFLNSNDRKQLLVNEIENFIKTVYGDNEIEHETNSDICVSIEFVNGSLIHLFDISSCPNWEARRYACIIYDSKINELYVEHLILRLRMSFVRNGEDLSDVIKIKF